MLRQLFFPILVSVTCALTSCLGLGPSIKGNGNIVRETRDVEEFDRIKVSRGMEVYIIQDSLQKVVVEADENLLDVIETKIEGTTLLVTVTENIRESKSKKVYISVNNLREISAIAGSVVKTTDTLRTNELKVSAVAGSNQKLDVVTGSLSVNAVAGSEISLNGSSEIFNSKAVAGSIIKAKNFTSGKCNVRVNSGSNIWICVEKEMDASASSGGNVYYTGNPVIIASKHTSGGNIIQN